jgi:hypothetical protein
MGCSVWPQLAGLSETRNMCQRKKITYRTRSCPVLRASSRSLELSSISSTTTTQTAQTTPLTELRCFNSKQQDG